MKGSSKRIATLPSDVQDLIAKRIQEELHAQKRQAPLIVKKNGAGSRCPLICIHPSGGDVLCYAELANRLGPDQPVYALRCRGLLEGEQPITTIEGMAAEYIRNVKGLLPNGPYALAGWSMGAIVAFEMAQQLSASNDTVKLLALLDMWPQAAKQTEIDDCLILFGLLGRQSGMRLEDLRQMSPEDRVAATITEATRQGLLGPHMDVNQAKRIVQTCRINDNAVQNYRADAYPGRITLFRCMEPRDARFGSVPETTDLSLGWSLYSQAGVEVHHIPGHHDNLMARPQVDELVRALTGCLIAADLPSRNQSPVKSGYSHA